MDPNAKILLILAENKAVSFRVLASNKQLGESVLIWVRRFRAKPRDIGRQANIVDHKNRSHVRFLASQLLSDTGANRVTAAGAKSVRERTSLSPRTWAIVELKAQVAQLFVNATG